MYNVCAYTHIHVCVHAHIMYVPQLWSHGLSITPINCKSWLNNCSEIVREKSYVRWLTTQPLKYQLNQAAAAGCDDWPHHMTEYSWDQQSHAALSPVTTVLSPSARHDEPVPQAVAANNTLTPEAAAAAAAAAAVLTTIMILMMLNDTDDAEWYWWRWMILMMLTIILSFFLVGRGPAYFWTSVLRSCNGPVH